MRTLLLGSDFTYNSAGNLVPIEINTNVGMESITLENVDNIFDLTLLSAFIINNNFTKITYIGSLNIINDNLSKLCVNSNLIYTYNYVEQGSITVPYVDDSEDHLIIRSSYDVSAIVDEEYCKNKVNFLNLIKNKPFGTEFAYINESGVLINNITSIEDNGNHPNFILKSVLPQYDTNIYPKLYKVTNQDELNIVLQNVDNNFFLMKYHINLSKVYENHLYAIRSLNILFPPNLQSIPIGKYTKLTSRNIDELTTFDAETFEIYSYDRSKYITSDGSDISHPKLLDTDSVEMMDGTFKLAVDLQIGDLIKTIHVYNPHNVDLSGDLTNYHITYDEFESGTTYTINTIIDKIKVDKLTNYVNIKFTDGTDWADTENSSYLVLKNNEVRFVYLHAGLISLSIGDEVILVDTSYTEFNSITKVVSDIIFSKIIFSGWEIMVEGEHIFLTKTEGEGSQSFAAIEHNVGCGASAAPSCNGTGCPKGSPCHSIGSACACG